MRQPTNVWVSESWPQAVVPLQELRNLQSLKAHTGSDQVVKTLERIEAAILPLTNVLHNMRVVMHGTEVGSLAFAYPEEGMFRQPYVR